MKKIIAANWKMNKNRKEAADTAAEIAQSLSLDFPADRLAVVFPPFTDISIVADAFAGVKGVFTGGQNFYPEEKGAFTGEISPTMLRDCGAEWLLVGHSERRHILNESDELIAKKTAYGLENGFQVMLCIGETLEERESGNLKNVLSRQLKTAIAPLSKNHANNLVIAYEPVWAIGTGKVAGESEIVATHGIVRSILQELLGNKANEMPILYGGSVNIKNAGAILFLDNVDGLLVGGASLVAECFLTIMRVKPETY